MSLYPPANDDVHISCHSQPHVLSEQSCQIFHARITNPIFYELITTAGARERTRRSPAAGRGRRSTARRRSWPSCLAREETTAPSHRGLHASPLAHGHQHLSQTHTTHASVRSESQISQTSRTNFKRQVISNATPTSQVFEGLVADKIKFSPPYQLQNYIQKCINSCNR